MAHPHTEQPARYGAEPIVSQISGGELKPGWPRSLWSGISRHEVPPYHGVPRPPAATTVPSALASLFLRCLAGLVLLWAGWTASARASEIVHHGPVMDIQIQRGEELLSIFQVSRLRRGDRFLVKPDLNSLAKGDWVLLLARISPAGNQVETRRFDLSHFSDYASIDITADDQVPALMLAPQLRNLFGLYTSFTESANFLQEVLMSDPQKFFDLQKVDQVNQAITALGRGLDQMMISREPEQAVAAAKELAFKFGVQALDPDCFKGNLVNTQCVAANIVASKEFAMPSNSDLSSMVGQKKAADLTSFLTANIHALSQAGDFVSHKYRDQYDFAPTFGRQKGDSRLTELFSLNRFRSGSIKTAYVYVPAWFNAPAPLLSVQDAQPVCWLNGQVTVRVQGRLPVAHYWHDWNLTLTDPQTQRRLAQITQVSFLPEHGVLRFDAASLPTERWPRGGVLQARLSGRFGFEFLGPLTWSLALPMQGDLRPRLQGLDQLIAGERATLQLGSPTQAACLESLELVTGERSWGRTSAPSAHSLAVDLSRATPGPAELRVRQQGLPPQSLRVNILNHRTRIKSVEHAELDTRLRITGEHLDRIAWLQLDEQRCEPQELRESSGGDELLLTCSGDIRFNAQLSDLVTVHHREDEPSPLRVSLIKKAAPPRLRVASATQALLIRPSVKATRWGLTPNDRLMSDDSGLSVLLQTEPGYVLPKGNFALQLRFSDDPLTAAKPIEHPLIADFNHQELRTRHPISFQGVELPSIVNPLEFRVVHPPSGAQGQWVALQRAVLLVPELTDLTCADAPDQYWIHGHHLDKIDAIDSQTAISTVPPPSDSTASNTTSADTDSTAVPLAPLPIQPAQLDACDNGGLCLKVVSAQRQPTWRIALRWVDQRVFHVKLGELPACRP